VLTAILVAFPEAAPAVDPWRERTSLDPPSTGMPAHVTLLFPFIPAERVEDDVLSELRALFTATPAFAVSFRETRRWPGTLILVPDPAEPFIGLTEAIAERWPDYPPYEGAHDTVVPHLTVAHGDDGLLAEAETDVAPALPIDARVRHAVLLEETEPSRKRWEARASFPLAAVTR
jgi:2'-5' RNA ligase